MMKIYIYWWYTGGEYLFRGAFSTKEKALEHLNADWEKNEMQLRSKPPFVQEIEIDVSNVINPYYDRTNAIYPSGVLV